MTGSSGWFYHTYGPAAVLYNPNGLTSFNDANPLAHPYIMYYNVSPENTVPGEIEATALAYSLDGLFWKRYSDTPVIRSGADMDWDANYIYVWSVLKINDAYHLWYSGGNAASYEGIGYAYSSDGINWVKSPATPLFHITDGIIWRSERCYTPSVLAIGNQLKMWFSGKDATTGAYSIGLAENNLIRTQTVAIDFLPGTCPNYLNLRQKGTFEVVVFGERDLNVQDIVTSSLQFVGEKPQKVHYRDAGSAGLPGDCPVHKKDGYIDLILSFSAPTIAAHFYGIPNGTVVTLDLTGNLQDGALIQGSDLATIVNSRRKKVAFDDRSKPRQLSVTPNPFNPVAMLGFEITEPAVVELTIYNLRGAVVTELIRDYYQPGIYSVRWDGSKLPSGIYLGLLRVGNSISVQRLMLLK